MQSLSRIETRADLGAAPPLDQPAPALPSSLQSALHDSVALNRSILEASADCIKIVSLGGEILLMNTPGLCAMEFVSTDQVVGHHWPSLWPHDMEPVVQAALDRAKSGLTARFTGFCPTALGSPRWWDVVVTPMHAEEGAVVRLLAISRDISSQRAAAEELRWTSEHDALTELPNRRAFEARLRASTIRAMEGASALGLLLIDLDHFKHVNDTLGHAAGDLLLKTFGARLRTCLRAEDYVARLGGDEFAVILHEVEGEAELLAAGRSILARLHDPIVFEGRIVASGASIGGALFPRDASCANDLLKHADIALYSLKASGRGGTKLFHNHMREQLQLAASQLSLARSAITSQALVPVYQPKVDLNTGRVVGFEALLRWHHPRRGLLLPDTIAEAFKDYELASAIGEQMQSAILKDVAMLRQASLNPGRISINAAPAEFLRDDFAEGLLGRLSHYKMDPGAIEIEVTEHVFIERGAEYVTRALGLLHKAGISIALDDFGTGYSSLSHLRDFPVDVVKIDRSFVANVNADAETAAIVTAVIDLAASLSINVVAEGVELLEQARFLQQRGCSYGQGYLFGRPVLADELPRLLQSQAHKFWALSGTFTALRHVG